MQRINGTVKWFDEKKGFGFITDKDSRDYFAHVSEIQGDSERKLNPGDEVSFESLAVEKGNKAMNIELI